MMQSTVRKSAQKLKLPALLLLCASATACATRSQPQAAVCPTLPRAPALSTELPPQDYSLSAQQRIKSWQQSLMGTLVMSD